MKIKLFTFYYPFGTSEQFLHEEVVYLISQQVDLTIIPFEIKGERRELPDGVKVDLSLAEKLKRNSELRIYPLFRNMIAILRAFFQHRIRSLSGLRDVIGFAHHGKIISDWAAQNIQNDDVLYTYWFERITYGIAHHLEKTDAKNLLVTRAHGYDLYTERRNHNFIPFREKTLERLDQVFTVSQNGSSYLKDNYGYEHKIQTSYLGIKDPGESNASPDNVIRIASCSSIIPLKRVDLIAKCIKFFSQENPSLNIEWIHFGGGDTEELMKEIREVPANLKVILKGDSTNEKLLSFYQDHYIHLFINLSTTEGLPVSIMEAISFGIPALAVNVGGVSEIVNEDTGILLDPTFDQQDVNKGIAFILENKDLRKSARKFFEDNFVAERNYHSFYTQLKKLNT